MFNKRPLFLFLLLPHACPSLGLSFLIWTEISTEHPSSPGSVCSEVSWPSWTTLGLPGGGQSVVTPQCHQVATRITMRQAWGPGLGAGVCLTSVTLPESPGPLHREEELCRRHRAQKGGESLGCGPGPVQTRWVISGHCIPLSESRFLPSSDQHRRPPPVSISSLPVASPRPIASIVHKF